METISLVIVAAIKSIANSALKAAARNSLSTALSTLKSFITEKMGENNLVIQAINQFEEEPNSEGWEKVLDERIKKAKLSDDEKVMHSAKELQNILQQYNEIQVQVNGQGAVGIVSGQGAIGIVNGGSVNTGVANITPR